MGYFNMARKLVLSIILGVLFMDGGVSGLQAQQTSTPKDAAKHAHPEHGPHHGELLELGNEEFHAELVVDEAKKQMVIYLLEKDAKTSVAIEAPFLAVNMLLAGKPMQIQLKAIPQATDSKGQSSCFGAVSADLFNAMHSPKADPKLAVRIRNKSYVTKIVHSHDHSGHNHAQQPASTSKKR
jgi:hypothetical protein